MRRSYPICVKNLVVQVYSHLVELHRKQFLLVLLEHDQAEAKQGFDTGCQNVVEYPEDHIMRETRVWDEGMSCRSETCSYR